MLYLEDIFCAIHLCFFLALNGITEGWCIGCDSKKNLRKRPKKFLFNLIFILCWFIPVVYFGLNETFKKNWNFSRQKNNLNDFINLLLFSFPVSKNKRIKQKTNLTVSKMKYFMTLVDGFFGKQLNNITENPISDAAGVLTLPLYLVFWRSLWDLFIISEHYSRVYWKLKSACAEVRLRT